MKRFLIISILILTHHFYSFSQHNYSFKTINYDNGLIDNYVEYVFQDSKGFIWIGTRGGLNRYDGHSFMKIDLPKMKSQISQEIGEHNITCITEDLTKNLWIGTLSGIYVYNIENATFQTFENEENNSNSLSNNLIEQFCVDKENNVWIATRFGLNKFDRKTNTFTHFLKNSKNPHSICDNYIYTICLDKNENLWIGTLDGGVDQLPKNSKNFIHYNSPNKIPAAEIHSIYKDSQNTLWFGTAHDGIYIKKSNSTSFELILSNEKREYEKFFSAISSILEDNEGKIWISSYMGGVIIYNKKNSSTRYFKENVPPPHNLCGNSIKMLYKDNLGNIWIASHGGGISIYSPIASSIETYSKSPYKNNIPGNIISCFCENSQGKLYIGTDGAGFSIFDPINKNFTNLSILDGLGSDAVLDIIEISKNIYAIATWNGGLSIYNANTNSFKKYFFESKRINQQFQSIYGIYFDKKTNLLWCNTFGDGMQIFDCKQMKFISNKELSKIYPYWNSSLYISKMLFDKIDNTKWFIDGLRLGRTHSKGVTFYTESDSTKNCSNAYFCNDIIQTKNGNIYIATYQGVKIYNRKTDCFIKFEIQGFNFNNAKSLLEDSHNNIWIATSNSLYKYNPSTKSITQISKIWGMPQLQYYKKSAYRTQDGHLYFGSLKGFIVLHEDNPYTYNITPTIVLTKLLINNIEQHPWNKESPISKNISFLKNIVVNHNQSFITIEFAVLNFIDNEKSKCKYKLVGFDKEWNISGNERKATYTNIPPGTYTFMVSTTTSEGNWIDSPFKLEITVLPPWWRTIWFKIIAVLGFIFIIACIIALRDRNIRQTNKQLEKKVDSKTKELQEVNKTLLEQKNTIEKHYENLREQQLVIEIKNSQLQEALNAKNKLITVIGHDFKNPLSTLLMYANMVRDKIVSKKINDLEPGINSIVNSAETIYSQMIEVLEWSASKDDAINYSPINVNLEILIKDVLSLINETAAQKNILIETFFNYSSTAHIDPRMMSTTLRNLIINSIKFTPRNGKITISVIEQKSHIELIIKDTGIGMSQDQIERILNDKPIITEDLRSGFGLQICKTFINRNKGSFTITSELNKGSSFIVSIPKGEKLDKTIDQKKEVLYTTFTDFEEEDTQRKMLVVDDNIEITNYLQEIFSESFNVIVAHNGKEGLDKALQTLPEIILSDINMPILDGKKLCQQLKTNNLTNHIPIILISAQTLPHEEIDGLMHGADDFISKPFNTNILKQKVHILLKNRELLIEHLKQSINNTEKFDLPDSFNDKIIKEITSVIISNISNVDFKVDMLAQKVGLSRSQLYRKTISVLGQSPNDYIKSLRLQQAIEMLKTGRYRISEIAYEVGFSDPGYFSSCFFEKFGVKPSDYGKYKD